MKRLFVGIELPKKLRERINKELIEQLSTLKKTPIENLHVTLSFIGEVNEAGEKEITKRLDEINFEKFNVLIGGCGEFDKRVIWVSVEGRELYLLADAVSKTLRTDNEFSGHVTIARMRDETEFEKEYPKIRHKKIYETVEVKKFALFESTLTPNGSIYKKISEFDGKKETTAKVNAKESKK